MSINSVIHDMADRKNMAQQYEQEHSENPRHPLPRSFRILQGTLRTIPPALLEALIGGTARLACRLDRRRTRIARVNLDLAFGESKTPEERQAIILASYRNLIRVGLETILLQGITRDKLLKMVEFENGEILEEALRSGRPVIFVTAHYGNWELGTLAIAARYTPISVVGRPLDWDWANRILVATREQFGVRMIPKRKAMKEMIGVMKSKGALGLVVDQNTKSSQGILVDFFGKKARHTPSAALLARKFDAVVIPVYDRPLGNGRYRVTFHPPLTMEKSDDLDRDILHHVQKQADITERVIREHPEHWLWLHQRWKNQYEELYRSGSRES